MAHPLIKCKICGVAHRLRDPHVFPATEQAQRDVTPKRSATTRDSAARQAPRVSDRPAQEQSAKPEAPRQPAIVTDIATSTPVAGQYARHRKYDQAHADQVRAANTSRQRRYRASKGAA